MVIYRSKDGTTIPLFVVSRGDLVATLVWLVGLGGGYTYSYAY